MSKIKGFKIQQRVTHNSGMHGVITAIFNGGGDHGCYAFQADNGARFTVQGLELVPEGVPPIPAPETPGGGRTIVRYETNFKG